MEKLINKTPIFNNETCPEGIKKSHALPKNTKAKLIVYEGKLEFVFEDNNEKKIIKANDYIIITQNRKHHINLISQTKFQLEFYTLDN